MRSRERPSRCPGAEQGMTQADTNGGVMTRTVRTRIALESNACASRQREGNRAPSCYPTSRGNSVSAILTHV